jgi:RNA-directed DNA polymerase
MFERIICPENLFAAWDKFRRGKRKKPDVAEFELGLEDNIWQLHYELKNGIYKHGGYEDFYISDPKRRHIHKATVRDRVVHQAVVNILEPIWEKCFILDSWASRKNKGTHAAVKRLLDLGLEVSNNNSKTVWVAKLDIRKYFASIDHEILLQILSRKCGRDVKLMRLLGNIINSHDPGLPLGNITSQLFAKVYLNELDCFVKHHLKFRGYLRYMDDFLLFNRNQEVLRDSVREIGCFLNVRLLLELHAEKAIMKTFESGMDFLGYVCFPRFRVLRTSTKKRMFRRVCRKNYPSYFGILNHCDSRKMQEILLLALD